MEVTCGQCHGRLLVETPGVVVACPHCGVHLSIPASAPVSIPSPAAVSTPSPAPAPPPEAVAAPAIASVPAVIAPAEVATEPELVIEGDTAVEERPAPGSTTANSAEIDTGDIELNLGASADWSDSATDEATSEASSAFDIFGGADEETHEHAVESGWHSAPNLFLSKEEPAPPIMPIEPETPPPQPALLTVPLPGWAPASSPFSSELSPAPEASPGHMVSAGAWDFLQSQAADAVPDSAAVSPVNFISPANPFAVEAASTVSPAHADQPMFAFGSPAMASTFAPQTTALPTEAVPSHLSPSGDAIGDGFLLSATQQFHFGTAAAPTFASAVDAHAADSAHARDSVTSAIGNEPPAVSKPVAAQSKGAADGREKLLIMLLLVAWSYASAVTIVLVYLTFFGKAHPLESLPDVKIPKRKGEVALTYYAPKNDVAPGHVLRLGQSERFGSVKVTPVKVTRGIVKFEHGGQKGTDVRRPTDPLLKLWLKFENVSRDQTFAPLDALLMFKRKTKSFGETVYANNFLGAVADRKQGGALLYVYDHPVTSEFLMAGQKLDEQLAPGKSWLTFIPSEEEAVELNGDLVWRFHFRKGYHPRSLNGVTTLVDVEFRSQDITDESAAS